MFRWVASCLCRFCALDSKLDDGKKTGGPSKAKRAHDEKAAANAEAQAVAEEGYNEGEPQVEEQHEAGAQEDEDADPDSGDQMDDEEEDDSCPELDQNPSSEDTRTEEEIEAIQHEIAELESEINISKQYKIIDRLGEGTFSSVYKAIDCAHPFYHNRRWAPKDHRDSWKPIKYWREALLEREEEQDTLHVRATRSRGAAANADTSTSSVDAKSKSPYATLLRSRRILSALSKTNYALTKAEGGNPVYVALKRIYVTSSPQRIANELDILADLRSARCTAYLISAIRHEDQVIAVMPYEKHQDFRTYYRHLSLGQMQSYFRCMLEALADCHQLGIIHRDVKPANFLFDVQKNHGTLCDFGLAQRFNPGEWHSRCLHALPVLYKASTDPIVGMHGAKLPRPKDVLQQLEEAYCEFFDEWMPKHDRVAAAQGTKEVWENRKIMGPYVPGIGYLKVEGHWGTSNRRALKELKERIRREDWNSRWQPIYKQPPNAKIGYMKPDLDRRATIRANRAGTRGFRAPEVVLKCPDQTMALDIWSVGVTLLCFLTRRFPFFTSNDDTEALLEIGTIFGRKRMEKVAAIHNRTFITNIPSVETPRFADLHELVRTLNPNIFIENIPEPHRAQMQAKHGNAMYNDHQVIKELDHSSWYTGSDLWHAVDLMRRCLTLDLTKRVTAKEALEHPFFLTLMASSP